MLNLEPARWSRWFGGWVALAVLGQLALFATATGVGLAGTSDSTFYLHAAGTLRTAGRLLHPDGSPYRYWPPLYPVLLALTGGLGALRVLHGLGLAVSLGIWSWLGGQVLPRPAALVLPWALALSTPWLVVSKFVWAETVFLALWAGYAGALFQGLWAKPGPWWGLATGLGFLLPLQRTAGIFLLVGLGVGLLLERSKRPPAQRWPLLGHLGLSLLGGAVWHFYALVVATPSVFRLNRGWPQFFSSAADYGFVLGRWLLPVRAAWRPGAPLGWALALVGILAWLWPRLPHPAPGEAAGADAAGATIGPGPFLRAVWAGSACFILLLLVSTTFTKSASGLHDAERYASVLVGPVLLLALHRGSGLFGIGNRAFGWPRWLLLGLVGLWLAYTASRAVSNVVALRGHRLESGMNATLNEE